MTGRHFYGDDCPGGHRAAAAVIPAEWVATFSTAADQTPCPRCGRIPACRCRANREQARIANGLAAVLPLYRAALAADLLAEARAIQVGIDNPNNDADTVGALIDEAEGVWSAIRIVDADTWLREHDRERDTARPSTGDGETVSPADIDAVTYASGGGFRSEPINFKPIDDEETGRA